MKKAGFHLGVVVCLVAVTIGMLYIQPPSFIQRSDSKSHLPVMTKGSLRDVIQQPEHVKIYYKLGKPQYPLNEDEKAVLSLIETYNKYWFVSVCGHPVLFTDEITRDPAFLEALNQHQKFQAERAVLTETSYRLILKIEVFDVRKKAARVILWRDALQQMTDPMFNGGRPMDVHCPEEEGYILEKIGDQWYLKNNFLNGDALPQHPRIERLRQANDEKAWLTDFSFEAMSDTGYITEDDMTNIDLSPA